MIERYCECGLAEQDPMHAPWHKIYDHNSFLMGEATVKRYSNFEKAYRHEWERSSEPVEQLSIEEPPF